MENTIDTRKVNRELFAYRVVDVHDDEFGFAQEDMIYTYLPDSNTKGTAWLRMQRTGETGSDRRKYFLYFADETEYSAYVDKHNDIYDLEGNYIASLIRSKFILFIILFIGAMILLTGIAVYLGGSSIMNTTSPFSENNSIHIEDNTGGETKKDIDILDDNNNGGNGNKKDNNGNGNIIHKIIDAITDDEEDEPKPEPKPTDGKLDFIASDEEKVIYPGYQDTFEFLLANDSTTDFYYTLSFTAVDDYKIPIVYRLKANSEYVVGNKTTWVTLDELKSAPQLIKQGENIVYSLDWKWEDDDTRDAEDTKLGIEAIAQYIMRVRCLYDQAVK